MSRTTKILVWLLKKQGASVYKQPKSKRVFITVKDSGCVTKGRYTTEGGSRDERLRTTD